VSGAPRNAARTQSVKRADGQGHEELLEFEPPGIPGHSASRNVRSISPRYPRRNFLESVPPEAKARIRPRAPLRPVPETAHLSARRARPPPPGTTRDANAELQSLAENRPSRPLDANSPSWRDVAHGARGTAWARWKSARPAFSLFRSSRPSPLGDSHPAEARLRSAARRDARTRKQRRTRKSATERNST